MEIFSLKFLCIPTKIFQHRVIQHIFLHLSTFALDLMKNGFKIKT
nr:MAG TPA: hypothetical protein [Caudoviricetes sp.]